MWSLPSAARFLAALRDMPHLSGPARPAQLAQFLVRQPLGGSSNSGCSRAFVTCSREGACMAFSLLSIPKRIHKTFSSLRTGIVLLILVVIASALGTFILQRPTTEPEKLTRAYSPAMLQWLDRLGLTDVFHAWWFLALLGLVSLSIVLVSIDRFPNAWRFYARPYRKTDAHFRFALPNKVELPIEDPAEGLNAAERALKKSGWPVERIADRDEPSLYCERHRFSVMAVYIVHASLLLIFAGGIIDGLFGYNGFMALQKGQVSNAIELRTGGTR